MDRERPKVEKKQSKKKCRSNEKKKKTKQWQKQKAMSKRKKMSMRYGKRARKMADKTSDSSETNKTMANRKITNTTLK